jgi:hypothetical protein
MTIFTKDPTSPEVIAQLRRAGQVLLEVTTKQLYLVPASESRDLPALVREWFVTYRGRSHAFRDGSHIGGSADQVRRVRNLTNGGKRVVLRKTPSRKAQKIF